MAAYVIIAAVVGYFFGSVPFGLLLTRAAGLGDVRRIGSGNIGTTNVLRTGRKGLAAATLLLDAGKGAAAAMVFDGWGIEYAVIAGIAAVLGHCFPVWLRLRGGKGVATSLGVLFALSWPVGLTASASWLATASTLRYSSLAALAAFALAPVAALVFAGRERMPIALATSLIAALIFVRHRDNIRRLIRGQETKIGAKSDGSRPAHG